MGRPPKIEERSEEIMRAFEVCVARNGLPATTLADVAAEAGLPRSLVRYFMGNRDEMTDRLIERLMARAESSLRDVRDAKGDAGFEGLLDLYLDEVFANDLSNVVMGELWHLSRSDDHIRRRLNGVYDYAVSLLAEAMGRAGLGRNADERQSAAYAIVALMLGDSSLRDFAVVPRSKDAMRLAAGTIVDGLKQKGKTR